MTSSIEAAGISLMDTLGLEEGSESEEPIPGLDTVIPNDVYRGITFKKRTPTIENLHEPELWQTAVYVRVEAPDGTLDFGDEVVNHPIMWRSFAAFAPVTDFDIITSLIPVETYNPDGVIVGDVLRGIMSW